MNGNQYRAVFSNSAGTATSSSALLTVDSAPAITSAASTTFTLGTAGSFTVTATGVPAPTFTESGALASGVTLSSAGTLAGTPAAGTGGSYPITITASNGVSPAASQSFTLTITAGPAITTQPTNQTVSVDSTATFSAAASGAPSPSVQWQQSTDGGTTFTTIAGATSGTLTLSTVTAGMTGNQYRAVFTNSVGTATSTAATLTVTTGPSITTQPSSQTANLGGAASFTSAASGSPAPTVQWQQSTDGGATFTNRSGATSGTLNLSGVTAGMNGDQYRAVFTNSAGSTTSNAATLTVGTTQAAAAPRLPDRGWIDVQVQDAQSGVPVDGAQVGLYDTPVPRQGPDSRAFFQFPALSPEILRSNPESGAIQPGHRVTDLAGLLQRSATAPVRIVAAVSMNTIWKRNITATATSYVPPLRKKPLVPMMPNGLSAMVSVSSDPRAAPPPSVGMPPEPPNWKAKPQMK